MRQTMSEGFQLIHEIMKLRWIPEIITSIGHGSKHYSEITSEIDGISNTELNRKLAFLLEKSVIKKLDESTVRSAYVLTEFGLDLDHIFNHFVEMGERYHTI